jgi:hypothetical protein
MIRAVAGLLIAASAVTVFAQAPASTAVRVRGTVESVDGQMLTVKARNGQSMRVKMADNVAVVGITKASIADVTSGKFIGTTTVGERDGALIAEEIHIFPEAMRGTGEGHRDWDLRPNSKMTNAAVANIVAMGSDKVMTVQYKGGEKKVLITPQTVVVGYAPADRSELKPGAPVFINSDRQPDGSLSTARVNVGLNGQVPPM